MARIPGGRGYRSGPDRVVNQQETEYLRRKINELEAEDQTFIKQDGSRDFTGDQSLGGNDLNAVNALHFELDPTHTHLEGSIHWNAQDKTLDVDTDVADVAIQVGQETVVRATNKTGSTITNGSVVYINGSQGNRPTIALADADTAATSDSVIGVATHDLANNATGYITTHGLVRDWDTTGTPVGEVWVEGDTLWASSTAGKLTKTEPVAPKHAVRVGIVTRAHATQGVLFVHVALGGELADLHDVSITTPTDNQGLLYESATGLWKNETITDEHVILSNSEGGIVELITQEDVWRHFISGAITDGCALTDNGDGTVSIASGEVTLRTADSDDSPLVVKTIAAKSNWAMTDLDVNYLYVDYNSGTPTWTIGTSISSYNGMNKMQAYTVARNGTTLCVVDARAQSVDGNRKTRRLLLEWDGYIYNGFSHARGGTVIGSSGLTLAVTAGKFYYGLAPVTHTAFDTSVAGTAAANVWTYWYNRSSWAQVANSKTIDATNYDNAGVLSAMTANRWRTDWVYLLPCTTTPRLSVIYGITQHTSLALAQAESPPGSVPGPLDGSAVLIGQVCIQKSAASVTAATTIASAFFGTSTSDHNNLGGLQGGAASEYYHLTSTQLTDLTDTGATTLHKHAHSGMDGLAGPHVPIGGIIFHNIAAASLGTYFNGTGLGIASTAWENFAICNGNNGTPNLNALFVRMATAGATGTGGTDSSAHTHSVDPGSFTSGAGSSHSHGAGSYQADINFDGTDFYTRSGGAGFTANYKKAVGGAVTGPGSYAYGAGSLVSGTSATEASHTHAVDVPSTTSSGASATDNKPAYYELVPVMRIA